MTQFISTWRNFKRPIVEKVIFAFVIAVSFVSSGCAMRDYKEPRRVEYIESENRRVLKEKREDFALTQESSRLFVRAIDELVYVDETRHRNKFERCWDVRYKTIAEEKPFLFYMDILFAPAYLIQNITTDVSPGCSQYERVGDWEVVDGTTEIVKEPFVGSIDFTPKGLPGTRLNPPDLVMSKADEGTASTYIELPYPFVMEADAKRVAMNLPKKTLSIYLNFSSGGNSLKEISVYDARPYFSKVLDEHFKEIIFNVVDYNTRVGIPDASVELDVTGLGSYAEYLGNLIFNNTIQRHFETFLQHQKISGLIADKVVTTKTDSAGRIHLITPENNEAFLNLELKRKGYYYRKISEIPLKPGIAIDVGADENVIFLQEVGNKMRIERVERAY